MFSMKLLNATYKKILMDAVVQVCVLNFVTFDEFSMQQKRRQLIKLHECLFIHTVFCSKKDYDDRN